MYQNDETFHHAMAMMTDLLLKCEKENHALTSSCSAHTHLVVLASGKYFSLFHIYGDANRNSIAIILSTQSFFIAHMKIKND